MSSPLRTLPLDPYWQGLADFQTHAAFEALAARIVLRPEVPAHVASRFDLVRTLVLHSAVDAELLEAAYDRTLLSFELALRARHEERVGADSARAKRQMRLVELENWAIGADLVEHDVENGEGPLRSVRQLRNELSAHPSGTTRMGTAGLPLLEWIPRLINGLYDDPERRRERKEARGRMKGAVPSRGQMTADLTAIGCGVGPAVHWELLLVENRDDPPRYVVAVWPLFDLARQDTGEPVLFVASGWEADEAVVRFRLGSGGEVSIRAAAAPEEVAWFDAWNRLGARPETSADVNHVLMAWHLSKLRRDYETGTRPLPTLGSEPVPERR